MQGLMGNVTLSQPHCKRPLLRLRTPAIQCLYPKDPLRHSTSHWGS